MTSTIKVDNIQDQDGNNIINENANTITVGASGDTIIIPSEQQLQIMELKMVLVELGLLIGRQLLKQLISQLQVVMVILLIQHLVL